MVAVLGELRVVPSDRVARVTGAQLQDDGVKGLEEILKKFDEPGTGVLQVGDRVEARLHLGQISAASRPDLGWISARSRLDLGCVSSVLLVGGRAACSLRLAACGL